MTKQYSETSLSIFFYTQKKPSTQKPRRRTSTQRPLKTTFEDIPGRRTIDTKRPISQNMAPNIGSHQKFGL